MSDMDEYSRESIEGNEAIVDLNTVISEFPNGDDFHGQNLPVRSLTGLFNSVQTDPIVVARIPHTSSSISEVGGGSMKVFLRVRPTDSSESTMHITSTTSISTCAPDTSKRSAYTKIDERHYSFTHVFGCESTQDEVYNRVGKPLLDRFITGDGCVLFAYGMTNGGKTHTIQGTKDEPGLFPRLVSAAIKHGERLNGEVRLSMLEIYQDKVFDLLSFRRENLHIRDNGGVVEVHKLSNHVVNNTATAYSLMESASIRRSKSTTSLNAGSSRSHAVYCISISTPSTTSEDDPPSVVYFHVIDLAGAERGSRTKSNIPQQREANMINTSLMQLWRCLNAMKRRTADATTNIPFREAKITHLLMPHLARAGLAGVAMLTCVNPQIDDYDETISVLGNASIACQIREISDPRAAVGRGSVVIDRATTKETKLAAADPRKRMMDSVSAAPPRKMSRDDAKPSKRSSTLVEVAYPTMAVPGVVVYEVDVAALMEEIANLKYENASLLSDQTEKEQALRLEVSRELEQRSGYLFEQIVNLQNRIDGMLLERETSVTKSCKKARRTQKALATIGATSDAIAAEEEMEQLKSRHALELEGTRAELRKNDEEMRVLKERLEAVSSELETLKAKSITSTHVPVYQSTSRPEVELNQRLQRDNRFKDLPIHTTKKSPMRSPLANRTNSPIRLHDLSVVKLASSPQKFTVMQDPEEVVVDENSPIAPKAQQQVQFSPYMQKLRAQFMES